MTKKDYVQFARIIRGELQHIEHLAQAENADSGYITGRVISTRELAGKIANFLQSDNSQFNREKFMIACELPVEPS